MLQDNILGKAIQSVSDAKSSYCKFLSANDSGETGGHQAGILISIKAKDMMFDPMFPLGHIEKRVVKIKWQDDYETDSTFTYYKSKGELRITGFGRGFPYLNKEDTGALFVFTMRDKENYEGYFLYTEDDINTFLDSFGLSPTETNRPIQTAFKANYTDEGKVEAGEIFRFIQEIIIYRDSVFPDSATMSRVARQIFDKAYNRKDQIITNPDKRIIDWTDEEYRIFRRLEEKLYGSIIKKGFSDMETFIDMANQVLNRRKSRAGKSLEHHIAAIFDANKIAYEEQVKTEGNKRPDFIFPSGKAYHDITFPTDRLISLASKTTCKDRWRQVINEADRLRGRNKYLLTLQQGISTPQLKEMAAEKVILVVPKPYISSYPREYQGGIMTVKKFIDYVKETEAL